MDILEQLLMMLKRQPRIQGPQDWRVWTDTPNASSYDRNLMPGRIEGQSYNSQMQWAQDRIGPRERPMAYNLQMQPKQLPPRFILEHLLRNDLDNSLNMNQMGHALARGTMADNDYARMGQRGLPDAKRLPMPMGRPM
jgi:hypothetical protein